MVDRATQVADENGEYTKDEALRRLRWQMAYVHSNPSVIVNCLVRHIYQSGKRYPKDTLWDLYGKTMCAHAEKNGGYQMVIAEPDPQGDIEYLGQRFVRKEMSLCEQ